MISSAVFRTMLAAVLMTGSIVVDYASGVDGGLIFVNLDSRCTASAEDAANVAVGASKLLEEGCGFIVGNIVYARVNAHKAAFRKLSMSRCYRCCK